MSRDLDQMERAARLSGDLGWTLVFGMLLIVGVVLMAFCF